MDLLKFLQKVPSVPPFLTEEFVAKFTVKVPVPKTVFPKPTFGQHLVDAKGRVPQTIAHRGHKVKYPENSIRAFEAAVEAGAHALETDVHLSKEGIVVLSHDADLKRCFGKDEKISQCDWPFLSALRTTREPHEPIARLRDLLELLRQPEWQKIWLMVDIKLADDPEQLMPRLAQTFEEMSPGDLHFWRNRIVLGYWTARYIPLCSKYFPGFSINNIGFSPSYSRHFLQNVPNTTFTMLQPSLVFPAGRKFMYDAHDSQNQIYAWTVNEEQNMKACIRWGLDGVVTDDVTKFLKLCEEYRPETIRRDFWIKTLGWLPWKTLLGYLYFNFWIFCFGLVIKQRGRGSVFLNEAGDTPGERAKDR